MERGFKMTHTVYADLAPEVEKRLAKFAKKAERYGIPFSYSKGEEHPQKVTVYDVDPVERVQYEVETYMVSAIDFEVECDELIRANGWKVLAMIEHGDIGNIVTGFGDTTIKDEWYNAPARCDHCGTNRFRSVTYIVEKDGEQRQVGKSCLKDYTGISPALATMFAEVRDLFPSDFSCDTKEWGEMKVKPMCETEVVLAHACDAIKRFGFVKSDKENSTKDFVLAMLADHAEPTEEGKQSAKEIMAWLVECGIRAKAEQEELDALWNRAYKRVYFDDGDYWEHELVDEDAEREYYKKANAWNRVRDLERNCSVLATCRYAKFSHVGMLAYMPVAYRKYCEAKAREEAREAARLAASAASDHVGSIGDRITFRAATAELVTSWETQYGYTYLYKFTDESGNVYVWFASRTVRANAGVTMKGTVKNHTERDGVKQTVLTRCALVG